MAKLMLVMALCLLAKSACAAFDGAGRNLISSKEPRCSEQLSEQACLDQHCFYCDSTAVPGHGGCFAEARQLPKKFYTCKGSEQAHKIQALAAALRKGAANPSDPCEGKPDAKSCDALDECTWCKAAAVPSSCFTVEQAKFLPPAVFVCDKKPPTVSRH